MQMQRPEIVIFRSEIDGKVYAGKVIYYEDWYKKHLANKDAKIFDIKFDKNNMPKELRDYDIPQIIDYAQKDFKEKTGMTWEEFNELWS